MPSIKPKTAQNLLRLAVDEDDRAAVELAIKLGANLEDMDADIQGPPPFFQTCVSGNIELCALFLDSGCSVNLRDSVGFSPLHAAAFHGQSEIIALLLERGAEVDARGDRGLTPLMAALGHDYIDSAALLARAGADMLAENDYQQSSQQICEESGYPEVIAAAQAHQLDLSAGPSREASLPSSGPRL